MNDASGDSDRGAEPTRRRRSGRDVTCLAAFEPSGVSRTRRAIAFGGHAAEPISAITPGRDALLDTALLSLVLLNAAPLLFAVPHSL